MATTEVERLVVSLEASITKFERTMNRANGVTNQTTRQIEQRFAKTGQTVGLQSANIASQFQDIAVQLQGGASPFTIALQQGTQLSSALGTTGLRGALAALAGGFASLVNPVSIATIALIALGGAAVQWITRTEDGVKDADVSLEAHLKRIKEIVRGYDEAERAASEYIERNQQLPQEVASSDLERQRAESLRRLGEILDQVAEKQTDLNELIQFFRDTGLDPTIIDQFSALSSTIDAAGISTESSKAELDALLTSLRRIGDTTAEPDLRAIVDEVEALIRQAADARVEVGSLGAALDSLPKDIQLRIRVATDANSALQQLRDLAPELRDASDVAREEARALAERASLGIQSVAQGTAIALELEKTLAAIDEAERRREEKSGRGQESAAQREKDAVLELIDALQFEYEALSMTDQQRAVANALRQAGAAATAEQRDQIAQLVNATYAEQQALKATEESIRAFGEIGKSALSGFISDLRAGKSATEALGNALGNVADRLLNMGLDLIFGGGGGFNPLGFLFGGRSKGFATGTANTGGARGQPRGIVHGQEAVIPLPNGGRVPVDIRMPSIAAGAPQAFTVRVVSDDEKFSAYVEDGAGRVVAQSAPGIVAASTSQANKTAPFAVSQYRDKRAGGEYRL